ncbi:hypothetical protein [Endozoicomonas numazuensis]|uniref:Uncharacterized protein n=1 Tax=Endozoicomonas numazuensis TaxID=1137799 RepID=A0A081NFM1_9GAMM|nr:hypothetical protein [Endozoicomonas numazuensis]KEQ17244.1 hypothetical protein GZ78_15555 [Endozoicomonas numazuensis]
MKTVLLAALLLVCGVSIGANAEVDSTTVVQNIAATKGEAGTHSVNPKERIQLPLGVLQKAPDGWVYWNGAEARQVDYYQSSALYSYLYSITTYVLMGGVTAMLGGYTPFEMKAISLLTTFGFLVDLGLTAKQAYKVYSLSGQPERGIWQIPFRDRKEPPLLILLNQHAIGSVHYTVFSLYDEEASDLRYIDDEYLKLAKILYKRGVYLTLTPMEEEPEEHSSLRDELARDSDLSVSIFQNLNRELLYHVDFSGSPSLPWQELSLNTASGAELDRQYISAISPLWIGHVADWLTKPQNWKLMGDYHAALDEDLSGLGEMPEQPGPLLEEDELGVNNMLVKDAESGCLQLDMGSMVGRLPASGVLLMAHDQHCLSIGRKDIPRHAEHDVSKSYTYNHYEAESTFLKWTVLKKIQVAGINWLFMNGVSQGHKAYMGWQNRKAVSVPVTEFVPPKDIPAKDITGNEVIPAPIAKPPANVAKVVAKSLGLQDHLVLAEVEKRVGLGAELAKGIQLKKRDEIKPLKEKKVSEFEKKLEAHNKAMHRGGDSDDESDDDFEFDDEKNEEVTSARPKLVVVGKKTIPDEPQPEKDNTAGGQKQGIPAPPTGAVPPPPPPPEVKVQTGLKIKIKPKAQLAADQTAKANQPKSKNGMDDVVSAMGDILEARRKKLEAFERQQQQPSVDQDVPPVEPVNVAMGQVNQRQAPPPVKPKPPRLKPRPTRDQVNAIREKLLQKRQGDHVVIDEVKEEVEVFGYKVEPENWNRFLKASRAAGVKGKEQAALNAGNIPEIGDDEWDGEGQRPVEDYDGPAIIEIPYQWIIYMWRTGLIGENDID